MLVHTVIHRGGDNLGWSLFALALNNLFKFSHRANSTNFELYSFDKRHVFELHK